jgi:hypothetical protein
LPRGAGSGEETATQAPLRGSAKCLRVSAVHRSGPSSCVIGRTPGGWGTVPRTSRTSTNTPGLRHVTTHALRTEGISTAQVKADESGLLSRWRDIGFPAARQLPSSRQYVKRSRSSVSQIGTYGPRNPISGMPARRVDFHRLFTGARCEEGFQGTSAVRRSIFV